MSRIYNNIVETVGRTPLVRLNKVTAGLDATILLKCEFFNPLGSVKDRIGMAMIEDAEKRGVLKKDTVIIEPTSGNTGIALAFVAAAKGYKLILTMPDTMSLERRTLLAMLGAKLVLTPGTEGMKGAIARAEQLAQRNAQFLDSPAIRKSGQSGNPPQNDGGGNLEGYGRQGGYSGLGRRHRRHHHRLRRGHQGAQAVVPGHRGRAEGFAGHFAMPGRAAAEARPAQDSRHGRGVHSEESCISRTARATRRLCECVQVTNDDSFAMARRLAKEEGLLVGISTGANVVAAIASGQAAGEQGQDDRDRGLLDRRALFEHAAGGGSQGRSRGLKKSSCNQSRFWHNLELLKV